MQDGAKSGADGSLRSVERDREVKGFEVLPQAVDSGANFLMAKAKPALEQGL